MMTDELVKAGRPDTSCARASYVGRLQARQPPIQSEKYQCRTDAVSSPDDGHIVARNM